MKYFIVPAAFAALSTGAMAAAPEQPASADPARAEKKICRSERATGSLTRRTRICLTAAEWQELNNRTRRGVDEMVSGASGGCRAPNGGGGGGTLCGG